MDEETAKKKADDLYRLLLHMFLSPGASHGEEKSLIEKALRAAYADGLDAAAKVTVDQEVGAGYVYLTEIKDGEAVEQIRMEEKDLIFDFNKAGELIGIEFLDLAVMPQAIRQHAKEMGHE